MSGDLLTALKGVPTPAGAGAKKRKGADNGKAEENEETTVKLLVKSVGLLLTEQRNTNSRIGHTLLLPGDHNLAKALEEMKTLYQEHQPVRESGKPGKPHPWGAPRHVNMATMFDVTIGIYSQDEALRNDAMAIWGKEGVTMIVDRLMKCVSDAKDARDFTILDPLCTFFRFRTARSGQGIVELTGGTGKVFATDLRKYNLFALPLENLWGILLMPYAEFMTSGSAPKGRLERLVAKHLPNNNK